MAEYWWVILIGVVALFLYLSWLGNRSAKLEEEKRRLREKKKQEESQKKYELETPARRGLIVQLYADSIDLKEITFILRRADYNSPKGEEITMKEIMEEHADIQIEKHNRQQADIVQCKTRTRTDDTNGM